MLAAYAVPAAIVWAGLGLLLGALPIAAGALVVVTVYGVGYGVIEASGRAWPRAPGSNWQVPQHVLIGAGPRRRLLIWGLTLGPGFLTRNPYAGFGMTVLLVSCAGRPLAGLLVAVAVGVAHGSGRALALLRDARLRGGRPRSGRLRGGRLRDSRLRGGRLGDGPLLAAEPFDLLLTSVRWRMFDGFALLMVAGAAAVSCGFRFG
ncbi:MAG: hypothetical protein ACLQFR_30245 [Streptosporangiaceae bacterium]